MKCFRQTSVYSHKGMTLPEVVIVLTIIGILVAAAIPNFSSLIKNADSRSAARHASAFLRLARSTAITSNRQQQVVFNQNSYGIVAGTKPYAASFPSITNWNTMPASVKSNVVTTFQFTPDGVASLGTGTLDLMDDGTLRYQVIVSTTGRISVNGPL